jgi:hypothetical protein
LRYADIPVEEFPDLDLPMETAIRKMLEFHGNDIEKVKAHIQKRITELEDEFNKL